METLVLNELRAALWDDVRVLPIADFLHGLWAGEVIA